MTNTEPELPPQPPEFGIDALLRGLGRLSAELGGITTGMQTLQAAVDAERQARERDIDETRRKSFRVTIGIGVVLIAILAGIMAQAWQFRRLDDQANQRAEDQIQSAITTCLNGNATRAALERRFDQYSLVLGAVTARANETEAQKAARDLVVNKVRDEFRNSLPPELGPRDCSPDKVLSPTTLMTVTTDAPTSTSPRQGDLPESTTTK